MPARLDLLSPTRREILLELKDRGEAGVEELSQALGITPSAVRQHVAGLEASGLLQHRAERGRPGRPRYYYTLSETGRRVFPSRYDEALVEILDIVDARGAADSGELVNAYAEHRAARFLDRLQGDTVEERLRAIVGLFNDDGMMVELESASDGDWVLNARNCSIVRLARRSPGVCNAELAFLRAALPGAEVSVQGRLANGGGACRFAVHSGNGHN